MALNSKITVVPEWNAITVDFRALERRYICTPPLNSQSRASALHTSVPGRGGKILEAQKACLAEVFVQYATKRAVTLGQVLPEALLPKAGEAGGNLHPRLRGSLLHPQFQGAPRGVPVPRVPGPLAGDSNLLLKESSWCFDMGWHRNSWAGLAWAGLFVVTRS